MEIINLTTREGYDRWAEIYDADDNCLILLEQERLPALLGDPAGKRIADIGCGTGRWAIPLAAAGAAVTALDFSSGMVAKAASKPGWDKVDFRVADLTQPLPLPDQTFDRVLCCLVLDHIKDLTGLFREMGRICRPDGFVVVSVMHPALMLRGIQARFTDPSTGHDIRPESVSHQVTDYVMAAIRAGLGIDALEEHAVEPALLEKSARAAKYLGWMLLLLMRFRPGK